MVLFKTDLEKCDMDGLCARECPAKIIEIKEHGPSLAARGDQFCIQCGHCVAICPKGAFSLDSLSPDDCMPIRKELILNGEQVEHFLRSRRSIRQYRNKPVPRDLFEKALSVACCAPTGSNRQLVRWLVFDKKEDVKDIASHVIDWMKSVMENNPENAKALNFPLLTEQWNKGIDRICRDAPQLVFAFASNEFGHTSADCHTAIAYLELALTGFGLGSCWAGYVNYAAGLWPALSEKLNLPENYTCHGALMVGIPKVRYKRSPKRKDPDIIYY